MSRHSHLCLPAVLLAALAACTDSGPQAPGDEELAIAGVVAVLEQAGYHGPAGISRWVAEDRDGTRSGRTLLLPPGGKQQLQQALAQDSGLQTQLATALEVTDPEQIDPTNNTRRADLGALVGPSILNLSPPVQSRVNFNNTFLSYDFVTDQFYIVQNGTILASKIVARNNAAGHYHGTEEQRSLPRRVGRLDPETGTISSANFSNVWYAPEFAQEVTFIYTVREIGGPNDGDVNDFFSLDPSATRVLGLGRVPPNPAYYDRVGGTASHPEDFNDWGEAGLILGVTRMTAAYNRATGDRSRVNDIALFFGGRFDLDANWAQSSASHKEHRLGTEVDFRPYGIADLQRRARFARLLNFYFATYIFEGDHYHARSAASPYR